ncbi:unnamed protein product [Caenorhabditis bovis]|uniref:DUF19 domain-containing protein n=1 Tax=Caenorhabditis bovis TaxID=2654633 RepID=A0A8S1ESA5_9PELO|nr:unnamed protein product [Caenorhabditis bovis]
MTKIRFVLIIGIFAIAVHSTSIDEPLIVGCDEAMKQCDHHVKNYTILREAITDDTTIQEFSNISNVCFDTKECLLNNACESANRDIQTLSSECRYLRFLGNPKMECVTRNVDFGTVKTACTGFFAIQGLAASNMTKYMDDEKDCVNTLTESSGCGLFLM